MIGNDGIKVVVEDSIHGFNFHRATIAFENIIDAFRRIVFPSVYLAAIAGLIKKVGVQFKKLIHVFRMAYDMVIGVPACWYIKIADH